MIETAVILAAGKGTRIRTSDADVPKPLVRVGDVPLVTRTILTLASAGVRRFVIVTGFMAEEVGATVMRDRRRLAPKLDIELAFNADFERGNGLSVLVGGARAGGSFLLSMADHVYTPSIARLVARQDLAAADLYLATDPRVTGLGSVLDLDDATKVRSDAGRIVEIGKQLADYDRIDCGVFAVTQALCRALGELRDERGDCSLSDGVRRLAATGRARIADIGEAVWQDVDTPADRAHAEALLGVYDPLRDVG
ncbi:MAG: NTP transferase domain-containing protein [Acidobacteriota bacterium]